MPSTTDLTLLYIGYFNRLPDPAGLAFWEAILETGFPLADVAEDFSTQDESRAIYAYFAPEPIGSPATFLTAVYENLLNRLPDSAGLQFWSDVLTAGGRVGDVILSIINGAAPADQATLDAKIELASFWLEMVDADEDFVFSELALEASRNALDQAGTDASSQAEALDDAALFFVPAPALRFTQTAASIAEDADTSTRIKIGDVHVLEARDVSTPVTLAGPNAGLFEAIGTEVFLRAGVALDHETLATLSLTLQVDDPQFGGTPDDIEAITILIGDVFEAPPDPGPPSPPVNAAPTVALSNTTTALAENTDTTARIKLADITVTDDGRGTNTLSLTGADAALFEIDGTELFLIAGAALDFETNPTLDVSVTVDDAAVAGTPDATAPLTVAITDILEGPIELSEVELSTDARGFVINGVSAFDQSGRSVSSAGDVNGDGFDDLIVGAFADAPNGERSGASFVVFGKGDGTAVELSAVEAGTGGFVINGVSARDYSGYSVSSAGDVNGDGFDDLIIGAFADDPNGGYSGASFVVFGKSDGTAVELSAVEAGTGGFVINGVSAGDFSGRSVSSAGDVNGDGFDDLIVGAPRDAPNGSNSGASFVVFGKGDGTAVELSAVEAGTGGFVINGVSASDYSGNSVSSAGDVNGDGFDDLIVGAPYDDPNGERSGASFVVFGKGDGTAVDLSAVETGTGGFVINGVSGGDNSGRSVSSAGDVNGDGFDDLIVGAFSDAPNGSLSGASFVVFGKGDGTTVALSAVEAGTGGFVINGVSGADFSGFSVSSAGDVNGDGFDDLIVGARGDDPNGSSSGASFVVFGKSDGTAVELSAVEAGTGGFVINGVSTYDQSGFSVSSAGDVNGDGFDDLIVGAYRDDPNGDYSGASFVVFGGDFYGTTTEIGTTGNDTLTGTMAADQLIGGTGDDLLIGAGGADVLRGGAGNDVLAVSDLGFADLDGGSGSDTLRLDGSGQTLDLLSLDNTSLDGIERIDLNGGGNTLRLDKIELQRLSDSGNSLRVLGDGTDEVRLAGTGWISAPPLTDAEGSFDVYTNGAARLEILQGTGVFSEAIAPVDLSAIEMDTDARGFVINGVSAFDQSGRSVSSAGDVNGDGFDDLIVGAPSDDPNGSSSGASFVVFGKGDGTAVELSAVETGTGGFVINGVSAGDQSGVSVSSAGDVNGDGFDDLIVGARGDDPNGAASGASFVVFGKSDGTAVELSTVEAGTGGFVINGVSVRDFSGYSVSSAGDVNGDGFDDLIVGAFGDDPNGRYSGASFVVFGKGDGTAVELSAVETGTGGFVINGVSANDQSGFSVSSAGDVNGDGFDDLIVGAPSDDPNGSLSGASFVVFGKGDGTAVELSTVEAGTGGFVINGVSANDQSGRSVSSAGDVNGDGFDDLIVGAPSDDPNGRYSGASFVVFGKSDGTAVELSAVEAGTGGFVINGVSASDQSGYSVSSAGDVNGDGFDDLIVGAFSDDPNGSVSGASFVVFGKGDGTAVELSAVEAGTGGFVINGVSASDRSGFSVSSAGDVNGDGFDDLIVGAYRDDPNGDYSGASFVVFGGDFSGTTTEIGTTGNDTLTGTMAADQLIGGTGDDLLIGAGGADVLRGGAGNDVLAVSDLGFADLDGGSGSDTLRLDGSGQTLDLLSLDNTSLDGIERIDLNGGGNTLRLDKIELQRLSDSGNSLRVLGDGTDEVRLAGTGWISAPPLTDAEGSFDVYTNGAVRLEILQGTGVFSEAIAPVDLSAIEMDTDARGFVINGVSAFDRSGSSVSSAGDVNGDGFDDLIVGAPFDDPNGGSSGASFVVFGKGDGTAVELSAVETGTGGFVINGVSAGDQSGNSVSSAGDVNGDGFDDLIVGARGDAPNGGISGASFVVFGKSDGTAVELSAVEAGTGGFVINGVSANDQSGRSVSSAGDVNGDGFDDLIVGAPYDDPNGSLSGASFVVFGKGDGTAVELSAVEAGTGGFVINGVSGADFSGFSVSSAGDVNGDGFDDLIVGARGDDPNGSSSGASFVVFGKGSGTAVELSAVEAGTGGFVINGVGASNGSGNSVSSAGDVNGDGFDDLIVGAFGDAPNGSESGASFVVFGKGDGTAVELSAVEAGTGGFVINGVSAYDQSGFSVSSAGDVNGDGFDDLIVGAYSDDPNGERSGASFVVFGKGDGTAVDLSAVETGTGGFVINGVSGADFSGFSVSSAGDVNGDGFDDLIVGARGDDPNGSDSGASFVVFGGDFSGAATEVGTTGTDTLTGTAGNDNIFAGTGNDTLTTSAGNDRVSGGAGEDTFVITDAAGTTTIIDFVSDEDDLIDVSAFGFANFGALQATFSDHDVGGHDTLIELDGDTNIVLIGVEMNDLTVTDFQL